MSNSIPHVKVANQSQEILAEIQKTFGMVPNFFRAQATVDPDWLALNWARTKQILLSEGALDRKTKELIAMTVSMVNHCDYCALSHEALAMQAGATEQEINEVKKVIELLVSFNAIANTLRIRCDITPSTMKSEVLAGTELFVD